MTISSTGTPSLCIVVNNYNYASYLGEALDSALKQINPDDELIVVDDGSTDASADILALYERRSGVRIIRQKNQGQMKAVRVGIKAAKTDVVVLLDSDDVLLPGYLQRLRNTYTSNRDISFVMAAADVRGSNPLTTQRNAEYLARMTFPRGTIGKTKWAALLFYEFVGTPMSGLSLHTDLAKEIMSMPDSLDATRPLAPMLVKALNIPQAEAEQSGFTADGVIVRAASILGANKFYETVPGFVYRIHDNNRFASMSKLAQIYLRQHKKQLFFDTVTRHFNIEYPPRTEELRQEFQGRQFAIRRWRQLRIRTNYFIAILWSRGSVAHKLAGIYALIMNSKPSA
jgi:glycosyltransferase involved in cell wall biosynthesis